MATQSTAGSTSIHTSVKCTRKRSHSFEQDSGDIDITDTDDLYPRLEIADLEPSSIDEDDDDADDAVDNVLENIYKAASEGTSDELLTRLFLTAGTHNVIKSTEDTVNQDLVEGQKKETRTVDKVEASGKVQVADKADKIQEGGKIKHSDGGKLLKKPAEKKTPVKKVPGKRGRKRKAGNLGEDKSKKKKKAAVQEGIDALHIDSQVLIKPVQPAGGNVYTSRRFKQQYLIIPKSLASQVISGKPGLTQCTSSELLAKTVTATTDPATSLAFSSTLRFSTASPATFISTSSTITSSTFSATSAALPGIISSQSSLSIPTTSFTTSPQAPTISLAASTVVTSSVSTPKSIVSVPTVPSSAVSLQTLVSTPTLISSSSTSSSSLPPILVPIGGPGQFNLFSVKSGAGSVNTSAVGSVASPNTASNNHPLVNLPQVSSLDRKNAPVFFIPSSSLGQPLYFLDKSGKLVNVPTVSPSAPLAAGLTFSGSSSLANSEVQQLDANRLAEESPYSVDFAALKETLEKTLAAIHKLSKHETNDVKVVVFCNNKPVQSFSVIEKPLLEQFIKKNQSTENSVDTPTAGSIYETGKQGLRPLKPKSNTEKAGTTHAPDTEDAFDKDTQHLGDGKETNNLEAKTLDPDTASVLYVDIINKDLVENNSSPSKGKNNLFSTNCDTSKGKKTEGKTWKVKLAQKQTPSNCKRQEKNKSVSKASASSNSEEGLKENKSNTSQTNSDNSFTNVIVKTEVIDTGYNDPQDLDALHDDSLDENRLVISESFNESTAAENPEIDVGPEPSVQFPCDVCGRAFAKKRYLKKHFQRIHDKTISPPSKIRKTDNRKSVGEEKSSSRETSIEEDQDGSQTASGGNIRGHTEEESCDSHLNISIVKEEPLSDSESNYTFNESFTNTPSTSAESPQNNPLLQTRNQNRIRVDLDEIDNFQFLKSDLPKSEDGKIEPVYVCEQCGKFYRSRKALKEHFTREHNPAPGEEPLYIYIAGNKYQCNICFNYFHSASELLGHSKTHTGELQSECIICGKVYASVHVLRRHIENLHADIRPRPFQCNLCDYAASNKWHLKEHYRRHTGEQPFQCPVCQKTFSHQGTMNRHCKIKHNIDCTRTSTKNIFSPNNSLLLGPGYMPEMSSIEKIIENINTEHVIETEDVE